MIQKIFVVVALASAALVGCSSETGTPASDGGTTPVAEAGADTSVAAKPGPGDFKADYKTSPDFFTQMSAPVKGTSPHGTARIWYSSNIKDSLASASFTAPEGTTSIKEFDMMGDGKQTGIAVMIKKAKGYDPDNGDWYYDMRDMSGKVMPDPPAGKIAMCIGCHGGYKTSDYLAGTKLK